MAVPAFDAWLRKHAYLEQLARFHSLIETAAAQIAVPQPDCPVWSEYVSEYRAGVPWFRSSQFLFDVDQSAAAMAHLIEQIAGGPLPEALEKEVRALSSAVKASPSFSSDLLATLLAQGAVDSEEAGLVRFFGWTVLSRTLGPRVEQFANWRDEDHWHRSYCPACGSLPAMGQLIGVDPGQLRFLFCGCCRSRWRFRRTGCPFCEATDAHRLSVMAVEDGSQLRLDYCEGCRGYLKTYRGQGNEQVMLADWTSLHLDILALDHGLKRSAASLYEV